MRVEVTQADIDAGIPLNARSCPIARAIGRTGWAATVAGKRATLWRPSDEPQPIYRLDLPYLAEHFVYMFDAWGRERVSPIEFDLQIEPLIEKAA